MSELSSSLTKAKGMELAPTRACSGLQTRRNACISATGIAKGGTADAVPPHAVLLALLDGDDLTALVLTAGLAHAMGHAELTAVGALHDIGSGELPHGRTSLVTSLS